MLCGFSMSGVVLVCVPRWAAGAQGCVLLPGGPASLNDFCSLSGEEVALYCAKYLPEIIKDQKAYKEGKLQKVRIGSALKQVSIDAEESPCLGT